MAYPVPAGQHRFLFLGQFHSHSTFRSKVRYPIKIPPVLREARLSGPAGSRFRLEDLPQVIPVVELDMGPEGVLEVPGVPFGDEADDVQVLRIVSATKSWVFQEANT